MTGSRPPDPSGPLDDPSERPTRMASYDPLDPQPPTSGDSQENAGAPEPAETLESAPRPWYRNRALLIAWGAVVAILVVLIIYGLIQLSHGVEGGPATTPSTTSSTTPTRSSTTTPTPTTTPPPPPPPSSTPEQEGPPAGNAPPPAQAPAPAEPPEHHHHLPHIPSTIPLPHTVITLPHGF